MITAVVGEDSGKLVTNPSKKEIYVHPMRARNMIGDHDMNEVLGI